MGKLLVVHSGNRDSDCNSWVGISFHRYRRMDGCVPKNIDGNSAPLDGGHLDPLNTPIINVDR